jgi:hypothetical protein
MVDKVKAQVQQPAFNYRLLFREPIFDLDELDAVAVSAAFAALKPWGISLENVKVKDDASNLAEETTSLNLLNGRIVFTVGPAGCGIVVSNPDWSEAALIIQIGNAAIEAVLKATGAVRDKQASTITMHLTPPAGSLLGITSSFIAPNLNKVVGESARSFAFAVYKDDMSWVVDKSAPFPDSLFVRMDRLFGPDESLEQIAQRLNQDEVKLLDLLGLEIP